MTPTLYASISSADPNAGICAQGFSMGSSAIAYSLAYYNAASILDNVELVSGPPASNIMDGLRSSQFSGHGHHL